MTGQHRWPVIVIYGTLFRIIAFSTLENSAILADPDRMKASFFFGVLIVLCAGAASSAVAQSAATPLQLSVQERVQRRVDHLAKRLALSEQQRTTLRHELTVQQEQLHADRAAARRARIAGVPLNQKQLQQDRQAIQHTITSVLTSGQLAELQSMQEKRREELSRFRNEQADLHRLQQDRKQLLQDRRHLQQDHERHAQDKRRHLGPPR